MCSRDKIDDPSPEEFRQCFARHIPDRRVVKERHFVGLRIDLNASGVVLFCKSWKTSRRIDNAGSPNAHEKVTAPDRRDGSAHHSLVERVPKPDNIGSQPIPAFLTFIAFIFFTDILRYSIVGTPQAPEAPVQLDDVPVARPLMHPVDVLRHHRDPLVLLFQCGNCLMSGVEGTGECSGSKESGQIKG